MIHLIAFFPQKLGQNFPLEFSVVDANGTAADFVAVENEIVMQASTTQRMRIQQMNVFGMRRREGVMRGF